MTTSYDLYFEVSLDNFDAATRGCAVFSRTLTFSSPTRFTDDMLTVPDNTFFTFFDVCALTGSAQGSCRCRLGGGVEIPNPLCTGDVCRGVSCSGAQCRSWSVDTPTCTHCPNLNPTCRSGYTFAPLLQQCQQDLPPNDASYIYTRNPVSPVSYDRCPVNTDKVTGLCYEKCQANYTDTGLVCVYNTRVDAGTIPNSCPADYPNSTGLACYRSCAENYRFDDVGSCNADVKLFSGDCSANGNRAYCTDPIGCGNTCSDLTNVTDLKVSCSGNKTIESCTNVLRSPDLTSDPCGGLDGPKNYTKSPAEKTGNSVPGSCSGYRSTRGTCKRCNRCRIAGIMATDALPCTICGCQEYNYDSTLITRPNLSNSDRPWWTCQGDVQGFDGYTCTIRKCENNTTYVTRGCKCQDSNKTLKGLICYPKCPDGYDYNNPDIPVSCVPTSHNKDLTYVPGSMPRTCRSGKELLGGLCYDNCRSGETRVGLVCCGGRGCSYNKNSTPVVTRTLDSYTPDDLWFEPVRVFSVSYTYNYYRPMPSYWVVATGITVPSPPTTDSVYPEQQTVSPNAVVFRVTVTIDHTTADASDVLALLKKIAQNSLHEPTREKNRPVFGQITRDHCTTTGNMASPLCRVNCAQASLLGMSGQACCGYGYNSCQAGWLKYCSDDDRFAGNDCIAFYQNSYGEGSQAMDVQVKKFIQGKCSDLLVGDDGITLNTGAVAARPTPAPALTATPVPTPTPVPPQPTAVPSPISDRFPVMDVCGCYLPQTVYDDYKDKLLAGFPTASASVLGDQQCYYPACVASSLKPYTAQQCSSCLVNCVNQNSTTLIAGGNINDVSSTINQVNNCGCFPNSTPVAPSPPQAVPTNSTPVAPPPAVPTNSTPVAPSPAAASPASRISLRMIIIYSVVAVCVALGIAGLVWYLVRAR